MTNTSQRCRALYLRSPRVFFRCVSDLNHDLDHHDGNGHEWTDATAEWLSPSDYTDTTANCGCKHVVYVQPCRKHDTEPIHPDNEMGADGFR